MGVHTGDGTATAEGYVGLDVHRAARICAAANGGQVVVGESTARLLDGVDLRALGSPAQGGKRVAVRLVRVDPPHPDPQKPSGLFARFASCFEEGRATPFSDVISLALSDVD